MPLSSIPSNVPHLNQTESNPFSSVSRSRWSASVQLVIPHILFSICSCGAHAHENMARENKLALHNLRCSYASRHTIIPWYPLGLVIGSSVGTRTTDAQVFLHKMAYYTQPLDSAASANSAYHGYGGPAVLTSVLVSSSADSFLTFMTWILSVWKALSPLSFTWLSLYSVILNLTFLEVTL